MVHFSIVSSATLALLFTSAIALPWDFKFKPGNEPPFPSLIVPTGTGIVPTAPPTGTAPVPTGTAAFLGKRDFKPHGVWAAGPTGTRSLSPTGWSDSAERDSDAFDGPQFGVTRKGRFKPHWGNVPRHEPQRLTAAGSAPIPGPIAL